jgi:hypothetical protein
MRVEDPLTPACGALADSTGGMNKFRVKVPTDIEIEILHKNGHTTIQPLPHLSLRHLL